MTSVSHQSYLAPGRFTFRVADYLGGGGFGIVEEIVVTASNSSLPVGRRYARKKLNDRFNAHPEARERFEREIVQIREMAHLTGVVNYRGENLPNGERFYVMDLFPRNLRSFIDANGARPWPEAAQFGAAIASTMSQAHALGFVHRDLKPENVMLTSSNQHVIVDWGLGYFLHKHSKVLVPVTRGGMGSEYYCSMEQWATGKCDTRGDIYSLGMLVAELARGEQIPIRYQGAGISTDVIPDAAAWAFNNLIREMTSALDSSRPATMSTVASRLRACVR